MRISKLFISEKGAKTRPIAAAFNMLLVVLAISLFFFFSLKRIGVSLNFSFFSAMKIRVWKGFGMTLALSAAGMIASLAIGILSAAGQGSKFLPIRYLCGVYVTFIRGTPLITQIYLFFYIVSTALGMTNRFVTGVLILSIFEGAYISEIIRGSLISMDASQMEAAKSVGFTRRQTFTNVLLPQITAQTLPALTGQFASIIKDSSLLSLIAVIEITQTMREISSINFRMFECYIFLGVLYLCLTLPVSFLSKRLERRFDYEH